MYDLPLLYYSIQPRYPELVGQVALVTGSSSGIGKGIAFRLAREGMKIVLNGIASDALDQTKVELQGLGAAVEAVQADVGLAADVERLFDAALQTYGRLDLLVNNAADLRRYAFAETDETLLDQELAANVRGPYICSQWAVKVMQVAGKGNIINISSVGGLRAHLPGLPYDMTKGAIDSFTRALALDLAPSGIRVNAIAPGAVPTRKKINLDDPQTQAWIKRIPLGRPGHPLDIAAATAFLTSDEASYITGQVIYVDGGITAQLSPPGQPV